MSTYQRQDDLSYEELQAITNLVFSLYRYDFREYAKASLKRRLLRIMDRYSMNFDDFIRNLKSKPTFIQQFISELTVNVTEIFRDPFVFAAIKEEVFPILNEKENIRIWHAGCSSGEEVISMAILLAESGLLRKASLVGTDINPGVLFQAKSGNYSWHQIQKFEKNYLDVPGTRSLQEYFEIDRDHAKIIPALHERCSFLVHNLVSDISPGKFDLVICRNVYIYFELGLQEKVLQLIYNSLKPGGILCLGSKESIRFTKLAHKFKAIDLENRIFQKLD